MMPLSPPFPPNSGLVVGAWLSGISSLPAAGMVASSLPRDTAKWASDGFLQYTLIPGSAPVDSGDARTAMVQLDAWAVSIASDGSVNEARPKGKAFTLAELVVEAMTDDVQRERFGRPLTIAANYAPVRVLAAWPLTEPTDVPDDPSNYARVTFDFALKWARL